MEKKKRKEKERDWENRTAATNYADKWFSLFIRERDFWTCLCCGKRNMENKRGGAMMSCGHLHSRVNLSTRWDEDNCFCQCSGCNMFHEYSPGRMTNAYIVRFGSEKYQLLYAKHTSKTKFTTKDIWLIGDLYRRKYDGLKG